MYLILLGTFLDLILIKMYQRVNKRNHSLLINIKKTKVNTKNLTKDLIFGPQLVETHTIVLINEEKKDRVLYLTRIESSMT